MFDITSNWIQGRKDIRCTEKSCYLADTYAVGAEVNQYDKNESDKNGSTSTTASKTVCFSLLDGTRATFMPLSSLVAAGHDCNPVIVSGKNMSTCPGRASETSHL